MSNRRGAEEGVLAASRSPGKPLQAGSRAMPTAEELPGLAEENADWEPGADPRLRLLGAYVARSLRPAAGAWERCAGSAEARQLLHAFLGRGAAEGPRPLLVVRPGPGGLAVRAGLDAGPEAGAPRAKGLFCLRTRPEPPGPDSLRGAVLCGDLPATPLAHLTALFSEVRVGLRPRAGCGWEGEGRKRRGRRGVAMGEEAGAALEELRIKWDGRGVRLLHSWSAFSPNSRRG